MKIVLVAGTGFLGKALENYFREKHYEVIILTRNPSESNHIKWDGKNPGNWKSALDGSDVLINLAGKSVDCRYTEKNKKEILDSRINSTAVLQKAMMHVKQPPRLWLNSSSATIYIHTETSDMTEKNGLIGNDFSMNVCKAWENEFFKDTVPSIRKVALRTAVVLGKEGGAFPRLKLISKMGLGGPQGKGTQYFSWIHVLDFCRAIEFIIANEKLSGRINISAPHPVPNKTFMHLLAKHTKPLINLPAPVLLFEMGAFVLRTETELLLKSRRVVPEILIQKGFQFEFPTLGQAFEELF
ncbi:MAG TPA: TIGR01777 family oxidoreductase [Saprospiraceae bacterium]|nr:TIGR01777 family oxidoreductase [Saprospiraceae bacterium]